jgi:hypothetical protein
MLIIAAKGGAIKGREVIIRFVLRENLVFFF